MNENDLLRLKRQLPELLSQIKYYNLLADIHLEMYMSMQDQSIEAWFNDEPLTYWTRPEALDETYANYQDALERKKHLEWIVKNIKNFAKNT